MKIYKNYKILRSYKNAEELFNDVDLNDKISSVGLIVLSLATGSLILLKFLGM